MINDTFRAMVNISYLFLCCFSGQARWISIISHRELSFAAEHHHHPGVIQYMELNMRLLLRKAGIMRIKGSNHMWTEQINKLYGWVSLCSASSVRKWRTHLNTVLKANQNLLEFHVPSEAKHSGNKSWKRGIRSVHRPKQRPRCTKNEHLLLSFLVFSQRGLSSFPPASYSITIRQKKVIHRSPTVCHQQASLEITHFSAVLLAACLSRLLVNRMAPPNLLL